MSTEIQQFDFKGASLRTLTDENGEPWFIAKDVCDVLGYTNASKAISDHVDSEDKLNNESLSSLGQRGGWLVNESGLYSLVLSSKLPTAKEFKRWVTHEVLPQIRRTGGYIPTTDVDDDMTILAKAVMIGQRTMEEQKRRIAAQASHIKELEPKARFADAVAASDGTCLIGELAKMLRQNGLDIGQNRLFEILRQDGYLGKTGSNRNVPTQRAMDLGLFRIKETAITHSDGHVTINRTAKVTGKGRTSSAATAHTTAMSDDLLTPIELAAMLGMSPRTLANWRSTGKGPPYLKIGVEPPEGHQDRRKVRYQRQVAERWASAHEYRRTVAR